MKVTVELSKKHEIICSTDFLAASKGLEVFHVTCPTEAPYLIFKKNLLCIECIKFWNHASPSDRTTSWHIWSHCWRSHQIICKDKSFSKYWYYIVILTIVWPNQLLRLNFSFDTYQYHNYFLPKPSIFVSKLMFFSFLFLPLDRRNTKMLMSKN